MGEYKAPKDKLICLLNACHLVAGQLEAEGVGAGGVGADDLFPAWIYVLVHCRCERFVHDLRWISMGAGVGGPPMRGECDYWMTMAESAVLFIEGMKADAIRQAYEGEWEAEMAKARAARRAARAGTGEEEKRPVGRDGVEDEGEGAGDVSGDSEGLNHNISGLSEDSGGGEGGEAGEGKATIGGLRGRRLPAPPPPLQVFTSEEVGLNTSFGSTGAPSPAGSPFAAESPGPSPLLQPWGGEGVRGDAGAGVGWGEGVEVCG